MASRPHSDPFDQGGQVTHQHVESNQHQDLPRVQSIRREIEYTTLDGIAGRILGLEEQYQALQHTAERLLDVTDPIADESPIKEAWLALWAELNADSFPASEPSK